MFPRLSMHFARGNCGHIKAKWDTHLSCLTCNSCTRISPCYICSSWTPKVWSLAERRPGIKPTSHRSSSHPVTGQLISGHPDTGHPVTGLPVTGQPGTSQLGSSQPGIGLPSFAYDLQTQIPPGYIPINVPVQSYAPSISSHISHGSVHRLSNVFNSWI